LIELVSMSVRSKWS